ncbi:MAG TPA: SxtJ family membrane protein [Acidimicrobiales bacterium]|nr:SxtJ family membrane protein [Acidimicrobiales bacterium]
MTSQSLHEDLSREEETRTSSDRSFGFVFAFVFTVVALLPWLSGGAARGWALRVAALFLLVALVVPVVLRPLNWVWARFALLLHSIVNPLVMGLMFFLVLTPMAVVMRIFGRDAMKRRFDRSAPTYWIPREQPGTDPAGMSNQF